MIERPRPRRTLSGVIDAVIETFSPRWAAERKAWRQVAEYNYRGARHGRTEAPKQMVGSADYELEQGRDRVAMVDRARALERDNALASALLTRSVENVISTGIAPQARSSDDAWNAKAEALFKAWCEKADVRGLASFYEMQALQFRSYLRDGDCGMILIDDGPERGRLQAFESDQLSSPSGQSPSQTLVDGVELDATTQRPVAYHIVVNDPNERITSARRYLPTRVRVPAESVVFIARRERLSQTRGLPIWAQAFWLFDQLDGHIEATTIAARMAACVGLVIHQAGAGPGGLSMITGSDGESYKNWSMEPGMIKRLQPGDAVTQIAPQQPSQQFESLVGVMCRLLGLPHGLPLELVTLDFSKTNYSSARAALLQAYRSFRAQQRHFIDHWCRPIWRFLIRTWIEDGLIEDVADWDAHEWIAPGWAWIDPTKEVQAHMMAVEAGLETLTDIARASGREFVEIVAQRKREREILAEAEIPDIRSTSTRDPMPLSQGATPAEADAKRENESQAAMREWTARIERSDERVADVERRLGALAEARQPAPPAIHLHAAPAPDVVVNAPITVEAADPVMAPAPAVTVVNQVNPTPVEIHNETHLAPTPSAPIVVEAKPGEVSVTVDNRVTADVNLPPPRTRTATITDPDGKKSTITIPGSPGAQ